MGFGSAGVGIAIGAVVGIPASILTVYRTYRSAFWMGAITTIRPMPDRRLPVLFGGALVMLALPIFLIAGWPCGAGRSGPFSGSGASSSASSSPAPGSASRRSVAPASSRSG